MPHNKHYISFNYNGLPSIVECKKDEHMKNICERFCNKIGGDICDYIFKYKNKEVDLELSFNEQADKKDQINCLMYIYVTKNL